MRSPMRRNPRSVVRQSLPLHRLSAHRGCRIAGGRKNAGLIAMTTRAFGAPITRNEDARLLSGQALFVDDVELPGLLHAAFLRSNVAHGRIRSIDVSAARAQPGVVGVYIARDLGKLWAPGPVVVPPPPIKGIVFNPRTQVPLAKDKVRHVGEPLAVVLAESRYIAEDALSDIDVEIDQFAAVAIWKRRFRTRPPEYTTTFPATLPPMSGKAAAITRRPAPRRIASSHGASPTITARHRRSKRAASSPIGTRARHT